MRTIEFTTRFKKDWRREAKGLHKKTLRTDFQALVAMLANDAPLPRSFHDHALTGEWKDHRDCHVKSDLVLIYCLPTPTELQLVRLGSHSELSL
jgi:mRNA interferase YafQ